jgi:hypothetical protein
VNDICGYRAFIEAVHHQSATKYHNALQNFGTMGYTFGASTCYGQAVPAETVNLALDSHITNTSITLGQGATMTILHADGAAGPNVNDNSLVVRLNLGATSVLLMGDAKAGGRADPVDADHHLARRRAAGLLCGGSGRPGPGRRPPWQRNFLPLSVPQRRRRHDVHLSSGPTKYGTVTLLDQVIIDELSSRGSVFRTDTNDAACKVNPAKIGPDADGKAGGCDNIRVVIAPTTCRCRCGTGWIAPRRSE